MEIVVIGTGGGYGESIVLRWDDGKSAVIDSCIDPQRESCLPLEYLRTTGADLEKVQFIVATHWHDDHIRGISEVLYACPNAIFWTTAARDWSIFIRLMLADGRNSGAVLKGKSDTSQRALSELEVCMEIIASRGNHGPERAQGDRLVYREKDLNLEIFALSPSELAISKYEQEIAIHIDEIGKFRTRIPRIGPNDKSVALFVQYKGECIILGADLEIGTTTANGSTGWNDVMNGKQCLHPGLRARVLKVAHHGSAGAQHLGFWSDLVAPEVMSLMTPWQKCATNYVPDDIELDFVAGRSAHTYITSTHGSIGKPKPRDVETKKLISKVGLRLSEVKYRYGLIRIVYDEANENWNCELRGSAFGFK
jgi:hypothetical protein